MGKCCRNSADRNANNLFALNVAYDDNSVVLLNPTSGVIQSTIYPPPTSTSVH